MITSIHRSVEAAAEHEANRREQMARGQLERQRLQNEVEAERERAKLHALRAETAAVESCGQAKAEAQALAERTLIECHSEIEGTRVHISLTSYKFFFNCQEIMAVAVVVDCWCSRSTKVLNFCSAVEKW
jgi:major vault protein